MEAGVTQGVTAMTDEMRAEIDREDAVVHDRALDMRGRGQLHRMGVDAALDAATDHRGTGVNIAYDLRVRPDLDIAGANVAVDPAEHPHCTFGNDRS